MWEVDSGLCIHVWNFGTPIVNVSWNPNPSHHVCAVATGKRVVFIATGTGELDETLLTDALLDSENEDIPIIQELEDELLDEEEEEEEEEDHAQEIAVVGDADDADAENVPRKRRNPAKWRKFRFNKKNVSARTHTRSGTALGPRICLVFGSPISSINWHHKGDYIAIVAPEAGAQCVSIHQLSKRRSQYPFTKRYVCTSYLNTS